MLAEAILAEAIRRGWSRSKALVRSGKANRLRPMERRRW
jgi:hypothetical protein